MKDDQAPVRKVIVKRGHGGGHHGGAWKVAYADFVTTMMALFIVLWIVGQGASVREAIAKYFRDPGVFEHGGRTTLAPGGAGVLPDEVPPPGEAPVTSLGREEKEFMEAADDIRKLLEASGLNHTVRDQIKIEVTVEGLRIELAEREGSLFFRLGSAVVLESTRPILASLAAVLGRLHNHITVEGHTDSHRYATRDYTNWELSADRANSARRILEASGLPPGQIDRVVGFSDNLPSIPGDRFDARNRRITIIVRRNPIPPAGAPAAPGAHPAGQPQSRGAGS
jgi:chemotaxis protein MotB